MALLDKSHPMPDDSRFGFDSYGSSIPKLNEMFVDSLASRAASLTGDSVLFRATSNVAKDQPHPMFTPLQSSLEALNTVDLGLQFYRMAFFDVDSERFVGSGLPAVEATAFHYTWRKISFNPTLFGTVPEGSPVQHLSLEEAQEGTSIIRKGLGFAIHHPSLKGVKGQTILREYQNAVYRALGETLEVDALIAVFEGAAEADNKWYSITVGARGTTKLSDYIKDAVRFFDIFRKDDRAIFTLFYDIRTRMANAGAKPMDYFVLPEEVLKFVTLQTARQDANIGGSDGSRQLRKGPAALPTIGEDGKNARVYSPRPVGNMVNGLKGVLTTADQGGDINEFPQCPPGQYLTALRDMAIYNGRNNTQDRLSFANAARSVNLWDRHGNIRAFDDPEMPRDNFNPRHYTRAGLLEEPFHMELQYEKFGLQVPSTSAMSLTGDPIEDMRRGIVGVRKIGQIKRSAFGDSEFTAMRQSFKDNLADGIKTKAAEAFMSLSGQAIAANNLALSDPFVLAYCFELKNNSAENQIRQVDGSGSMPGLYSSNVIPGSHDTIPFVTELTNIGLKKYIQFKSSISDNPFISGTTAAATVSDAMKKEIASIMRPFTSIPGLKLWAQAVEAQLKVNGGVLTAMDADVSVPCAQLISAPLGAGSFVGLEEFSSRTPVAGQDWMNLCKVASQNIDIFRSVADRAASVYTSELNDPRFTGIRFRNPSTASTQFEALVSHQGPLFMLVDETATTGEVVPGTTSAADKMLRIVLASLPQNILSDIDAHTGKVGAMLSSYVAREAAGGSTPNEQGFILMTNLLEILVRRALVTTLPAASWQTRFGTSVTPLNGTDRSAELANSDWGKFLADVRSNAAGKNFTDAGTEIFAFLKKAEQAAVGGVFKDTGKLVDTVMKSFLDPSYAQVGLIATTGGLRSNRRYVETTLACGVRFLKTYLRLKLEKPDADFPIVPAHPLNHRLPWNFTGTTKPSADLQKFVYNLSDTGFPTVATSSITDLHAFIQNLPQVGRAYLPIVDSRLYNNPGMNIVDDSTAHPSETDVEKYFREVIHADYMAESKHQGVVVLRDFFQDIMSSQTLAANLQAILAGSEPFERWLNQNIAMCSTSLPALDKLLNNNSAIWLNVAACRPYILWSCFRILGMRSGGDTGAVLVRNPEIYSGLDDITQIARFGATFYSGVVIFEGKNLCQANNTMTDKHLMGMDTRQIQTIAELHELAQGSKETKSQPGSILYFALPATQKEINGPMALTGPKFEHTSLGKRGDLYDDGVMVPFATHAFYHGLFGFSSIVDGGSLDHQKLRVNTMVTPSARWLCNRQTGECDIHAPSSYQYSHMRRNFLSKRADGSEVK